MTVTHLAEESEIWRNPGQSRVVVLKLDHRGELNNEEMVRGEGTLVITATERELNSLRAYSPDMDVFRNGTLVPVKLVEGSDIERELAANPNLLADEDMRAAVAKAKGRGANEAFLAKLAEITNATTLNRLLAIAEEEDAPVSKVRAIQARLAEVEGVGFVPGGAAIDGPAASGVPGREPPLRPVTPR